MKTRTKITKSPAQPTVAQVRDALRKSGMQQKALAKLTGLSEACVSRFMTGKSNGNTATYLRLSAAMKRVGSRTKRGAVRAAK